MNVIELRTELDEVPLWLPEFTDFCYNVLDYMKIDRWEVSIVLCDDPFIRKLNKTYRGMDKPTDVLSFPLLDEMGDDPTLYVGDIVISLDSVKRNAESFTVSEEEELKRVYIHGVLHLRGMDHKTNGAEEPMLSLQEEALQSTMGEPLF